MKESNNIVNNILKVTTVFFLLILVSQHNSQAQGTSNKGKEFWVAYQSNSDNLSSKLSLFLTSTKNAKVNINAAGTALNQVSLVAGKAVSVVIDPKDYPNTYISVSDDIQKNAAIHVTSDEEIIVYCHISNAARSASSLVLPVKALGNQYYAIAYTQSAGSNTREAVSEFSMVGVEDNTVVEINPTVNSLGNTKIANASFTVTLDKGDVYQYKSDTDVTGTSIKTVGGCKPLAVFSGSTFVSYCEPANAKNAGTGDPLYQQLFPTSAWGRNFVTAPFYNAQNGAEDIIRVQVSKDNTTLKVNGSTTSVNGVPLNNPYSTGDVITYSANSPTIIESDLPISVAQFQVTQACNPNNTGNNNNNHPFPGDPEMTILNPIEQSLKDITVYSAISTNAAQTSITKHYLNIILKTADIPTLTVDGDIPIGNFIAINDEYSFITIDVTSSSQNNPAHRIKCDNGFTAIAYGYGVVESYAYLAGADLKNLNAAIDVYEPGNTSAVNTLCIGEDYNAVLKLPYLTNEITWNFNNGAKTDKIENPAYREETVNGKTSYYYDYSLKSSDLQTAGSFILKTTVLNPNPTSCDANEEISSELEVVANPIANFTVDNQQICAENSVSFTDASNGNGKSIVKWNWDFGDGGTVQVKTSNSTFTHTFSSSGDYIVKLFVEGETGCASPVFTKTIHVYELPKANFDFGALQCEKNDISFIDKSSTVEGSVQKWEWDFGDVASTTNNSSLQNPTHVFNQAKSYTVTLKVTTSNGCVDTITKQIAVKALPIPNFNSPDICLDDASAKFTNTSTIDGNSNLSYLWDFGDPSSGAANSSNLENPTHIYSKAEDYNVKLIVTSASGCSSEIIKVFTVNGSTPEAKFTIQNENQLCSNQPVIFEDISKVDFGEITKIEWYFDFDNHPNDPDYILIDNAPAKRNTSVKTYPFPYPAFSSPLTKIINVKMKVFSGTTCTSEIIKTIILKAVPKVEFNEIPAVCLNVLPYQLTQASETSNFSGSGRFSGTGVNSSGIFSPTSAGVGTHTLTYTFTGTNGCSESKSQDVTVKETPFANAGPDQAILIGGTTQLQGIASGKNISYQWIPSDYLSDDKILNPIASPSVDTKYTLLVTSEEGCEFSDEIVIKVLQFPEIPNTFTPNGDGVNDLWDIKYLGSYPNVSIIVFNRYGKVVYKAYGYSNPWDGKLDGNYLPDGSYYYVITAKGGEIKYTGAINIIK